VIPAAGPRAAVRRLAGREEQADESAAPVTAPPRGGAAPGRARRGPRPRRTVRLRLTALYGALFFVSGAVLLAVAGGFAVGRSSQQVQSVPAPGHELAPGSAEARIRQLQHQLDVAQGSSRALSAFSENLIIASLAALALMTVASVLMGWVIAGRALRPVRRMTAAAQRISAHNLDERLAVSGPADELKELGDTFDGLLGRLEAAFNAQRRFVANASHELRTPLTTMRASLDVAVAKPEPAPPQTIALAARLRAELDRVDGLLEAFLVLARAQHGDLPGWTVLPVEYLVGAALAGQQDAIAAMRLTVQDASGACGAWVTGSQALLSRMVENVIGNAVGHNASGGWIAVTTRASGGWARLVVENGGEVLDQRQVSELSEPFRRLGADRTGSDQGSGLGLSIVAAIAEAHGGALHLRARPGGGLQVSIDLPASAAAPARAAT
jgi:signal transduction histidine kinase